jgi:hypothetical protein
MYEIEGVLFRIVSYLNLNFATDFKKLVKQIDYEFFVALGYSHRKSSKRLLMTITSQLFEWLKTRFKLNVRFKGSKELEKALGIITKATYTYPDLLKVDITFQFRITPSKNVDLDGPDTSFPAVVLKLQSKLGITRRLGGPNGHSLH